MEDEVMQTVLLEVLQELKEVKQQQAETAKRCLKLTAMLQVLNIS